MKPAGRPDTLADLADTFPRSLGMEMEDFWGRVYRFMAHGERNGATTATTTMVDMEQLFCYWCSMGAAAASAKPRRGQVPKGERNLPSTGFC